MKRFKLMKGVLACLLSLALVITCFGSIGIKADDEDVINEGDPAPSGSAESTPSGSAESTPSGSAESTSAESTSGSATVIAVYDADKDAIVFTANSAAIVYFAEAKATESKIAKAKFDSVELKKDEKTNNYSAVIAFESKAVAGKAVKNIVKDQYFYYTTTQPTTDEKYNYNLKIAGTATKETLKITLNYVAAYEGSEVSAIASAKTGTTDVKLADLIYRAVTTVTVDSKKVTTNGEWQPATEFTGDVLAKDIAKISVKGTKDKVIYQFKVKGTSTVGTTDGTHASKLAKVTPKKAAAAPKLKVDYAKETINIKNGFDFAVSSNSGVPSASGWITIKPQNASGSGADTVSSVDFVPANAKDVLTNAESFTKTSFKAYPVSELFEEAGNPETIYVYVRKSATTKAPASAVSNVVTITKKAAAPSFSGEVELTTLSNKSTFKTPEALADGKYQYLIVTDADTDISKAKWTTLGTSIQLGKAKSLITPKPKKENTLDKTDGTYKIYIRKTAVKENAKKNISGELSSEYVVTVITTSKTSGSSESTSGASTADSKVVWKAVESSESSESSASASDTPAATTYTVTYKVNVEGSAVEDVVVTDAQAAEYALIEKPESFVNGEMVFKGWSETADGAPIDAEKVTLTKDTTYFAIWADS